MQRHSTKESEIKIPPNLLKNFNVYDILEPQKNGATKSDATVDKLVDIDDCSQDSGFKDSDLNPAFLDKHRDFDLVDLYQNILVTPQHIKMKEANDEFDAPFSASKVIDDGYKQFFDMLESGEKYDWTNISQPEEETNTQHDLIEKKPRVLVPKVFMEPDSDPEDLIHEVLMQKKLENIVYGNLKSNSFNGNSSGPQERESHRKIKKPDVIPEFSRLNLNGVTKDSKFESGCNENLPRPSEIETCPVDSQMNNSLPNFTVRAIQKDEKLYKKKRLLKPESQTANYTKGPDFYEKSVVLPQIMARLHARLAYLDEKGSQKKKFVLDTGVKQKTECNSSNVNAQVKKKPTNQVVSNTLTTKEHVKTKPNSQAECSSFTKKDPAKKAANNTGSLGIKLDNGRITDEGLLCINKVTKDIRVHIKDKPCPNCSDSSTAQKASPVATSSKTDYGKLSPIVLLEDCNTERLRALKQSQMFKDFVYKGKYDL